MNDAVVKRIIRGHRQYRLSDHFNGEGISKIWNHGMGRIGFLAATEKGDIVVNALFWRKTDAVIAVAFIKEVMKDNEKRGIAADSVPSVICVDYGYPYYYNHAFGEHNPPTNTELANKIHKDIAAEMRRVK